ncbi:MAG: hypothetical protein M1830_008085 [Pleopsidium flavum]|nr:MAG: hypothetical protein M1830_008085 [Pleopsidium flavum]
MLLSSCGHASSFCCGFGCRQYSKASQPWTNQISVDKGLRLWNTDNPRELIGTRKRPWENPYADERNKRLASGRLTFIPGTFRPVIILDDDDGTDPVVPRTIDRSGRSKDDPMIIEGDEGHLGVEASHTTNPPHHDRQASTCSNSRDDAIGLSTCNACDTSRSLSSDAQSKASSAAVMGTDAQGYLEPSDAGCTEDIVSWTLDETGMDWTSLRSMHLKHRSRSLPICLKGPSVLVRCSRLETPEKDSGAWSDSQMSPPKRKTPKDTLSVEHRKSFFIHSPTSAMKSTMAKCVSEVQSVFPQSREEDECWLHPSPPPLRSNGRASGCLKRDFRWADELGRHKITVNFGVIALIVEDRLTESQKEGWIMQSWHLSHLCGNWTCCNWRHFTVEPGGVNITRNACFMHRSGCEHSPKCMKEKKQQLNQTARVLELEEDYQAFESRLEEEEHADTTKGWPEVVLYTDREDTSVVSGVGFGMVDALDAAGDGSKQLAQEHWL